MKQLLWSSVLVMGFVASPALQMQGASLIAPHQRTIQAFDPPIPDPNSPNPPVLTAFDPPIPDPNSPNPPVLVAFDPPVPDPNSPNPPSLTL